METGRPGRYVRVTPIRTHHLDDEVPGEACPTPPPTTSTGRRDGSSGLPVVDSTPRRGSSGSSRYLHGLSRPPRRERRALRKQKRRERSTVVGRHPKTTVLLLVLLLLTPVWASLASAATNPALGPTSGAG